MLRAQVSHTSSLDTAPLTEVLGMTMGFFFPAQSEFWLNFPGGYLLKKRFSRRSLVCTCRWNMRQIDFDCQTCMYNWFGCTLKKKKNCNFTLCVWVSERASMDLSTTTTRLASVALRAAACANTRTIIYPLHPWCHSFTVNLCYLVWTRYSALVKTSLGPTNSFSTQ